MHPVIKYKPYFLLAIELDAEWSRARSFGPTTSNADPLSVLKDRIELVCSEYRSSIENAARASCGQQATTLDEILFRPLFCLPSGHADALAFVLADDFDAVHHITSHTRVIEDMTLAFCPERSSLGIEGNRYIVDVEDHWKEEFSVTIFSRLKLDGVCNLEYGLLFKRAIIRMMASRVRECADAYPALLLESKGQASTPSFAVSFLCLQGQEEIGVLCSSTDASLAVALSSAFRSLTLPELFNTQVADAETTLLQKLLLESHHTARGKNHYLSGDLHRSLLLNARNQSDLQPVPVFRWSKSVLAFRLIRNGCELQLGKPVTGMVRLDLDLQLVPGIKVDFDFVSEPPPQKVSIPPDWRFVQVGSFDSRRTVAAPQTTISATAAVQHILNCIAIIVRRNAMGNRVGIVGISSVFSIPVPNIWPFCVTKTVAESPLDERLYRLRHLLESNPQKLFMSMDALSTIPLLYGMPTALRRSIEALFHNFATAVSNPNSYDLVIDLYDVFNTLHRTLTEIIPSQLRSKDGELKSIDPRNIFRISQFATALRNALERRLVLAYPDSTVRNVSLQFPGSLVQILFATDAPLKAALGVLKYHLPVESEPTLVPESQGAELESSLSRLDRVGVVVDITLEPGIRAVTLPNLNASLEGVEPARLSYLSLDVDHLFYVGSLYDYIHEAFHLVFDQMVMASPTPIARELSDTILADIPKTAERVEEIFVQLTCFLYCAPERPLELLYYLVGKYALDMRSGLGNLAARISHFAERLAWIVIPCWLVSTRLDQKDVIGSLCTSASEAVSFLNEHIYNLFEYLPETAKLGERDKEVAKAACLRHLEIVWTDAHLTFYLPKLWEKACKFYENLGAHHRGFSIPDRPRHDASLTQLARGYAVTRYDVDAESYIDSVAVTALVLGRYFTRHGISDVETTRMLLDRDKQGKVVFTTGRYARFLIERGSAQRACFDPVSRGERLRNQIAILESFWDCSSHFRARRVADLLTRFELQ